MGNYEQAVKAQDAIIKVLDSQGIEGVGVGLGLKRPVKKWIVTLDFTRPVSAAARAKINSWKNSIRDIEVEERSTGFALAYSED
ncbi:MAG: hypothetical protein AAGA80_07565 [Cyanobacteria bacterium P01_F01_bin.143]